MSGIVIMGQVFCSLVSGFLLDFQRVFWLCDSCFVGVLSWCVNSEWLLVSEAVIVSEWSKRRKKYHSRLPVTEMGVSLGWGLDLWSIRRHTFSSVSLVIDLEVRPLDYQECLMEFGSEKTVVRQKLKSVGSQRDGSSVKEGLPWSLCCRGGMRLGH